MRDIEVSHTHSHTELMLFVFDAGGSMKAALKALKTSFHSSQKFPNSLFSALSRRQWLRATARERETLCCFFISAFCIRQTESLLDFRAPGSTARHQEPCTRKLCDDSANENGSAALCPSCCCAVDSPTANRLFYFVITYA